MDKHLNELASKIKDVRLSEEERARARRVVDAYAQGTDELHSKSETLQSSSQVRRLKTTHYLGIAGIVVAGIVINWLVMPLFTTTTSTETLADLPNAAVGTVVISRGTFTDGAPGHHGEGTAVLLRYDDGTYAVRFEDDFKVTNGPDLFVYFGKDGEIDKETRFSSLTASMGGQNYLIPAEIDVSAYNEVWVWCRAFGVKFAAARLEPVTAGQ